MKTTILSQKVPFWHRKWKSCSMCSSYSGIYLLIALFSPFPGHQDLLTVPSQSSVAICCQGTFLKYCYTVVHLYSKACRIPRFSVICSNLTTSPSAYPIISPQHFASLTVLSNSHFGFHCFNPDWSNHSVYILDHIPPISVLDSP